MQVTVKINIPDTNDELKCCLCRFNLISPPLGKLPEIRFCALFFKGFHGTPKFPLPECRELRRNKRKNSKYIKRIMS